VTNTVHWVTTAPNPRTPATGHDAGQRGWKQHAVVAPADATFTQIKGKQALCGRHAAHGWGMDLFIEDKCMQCQIQIDRMEK
jgi:hypothetical protein